MSRIQIVILIFLLSFNTNAQNFSEWRGKGRTGVYKETNLLKEWPKNGPELIWHNDSLLDGYSSAAIYDSKVYITGISKGQDYLIALNNKGKELWRIAYGKGWDSSFEPSRATATIEKNKVYVSSGSGDIACIDAQKGTIIWKVEATNIYKGKIGRFGISESLLIDDKYVFYTPAGDETTMVALDKNTGKLVWKSESLSDEPSYCSPLMIEEGGKRIIVNVIKKYIFGVNPETGEILWKFDYEKFKGGHNNNTNTPIYDNYELYI